MKKRTFIQKEFRPKVKGMKLKKVKKIDEDKSSTNFCNLSCSDNLKTKKALIFIHVKDDNSQTKAIKRALKFYKDNREVVFLNYDELGYKWNFCFQKNKLIFCLKNLNIEPLGIYNRPYIPDSNHPKFYMFNNFIQAVEFWKGNYIGARSKNFHNSSKPLQLTTTIRSAISSLNSEKISIPDSFFIKGKKKDLKEFFMENKKLIVKSCCGIRSEVTNNFKNWNFKNIEFLPTFFQRLEKGKDIRVHRFEEKSFSVKIEKKESVDYRYALKKSPYEKYRLNELLEKFCETLRKEEDIGLVGIDFIQNGGRYICLECNPNPGWAGFHRRCGEENLVAHHLIENLDK